MPIDLKQYAFSAGEISPRLFARSDLEKYSLGVAEAHNFFVDYRGGLSSRMGTELVGRTGSTASDIRLIPFEFSPEVQNTYLLVFEERVMRVVQSGGFVLNPDGTVFRMTTPYLSADLADLRFYQRHDLFRITHPRHAVMNLTRIDHANWVLGEESFEIETVSPSNVRLTPSGAGAAGIAVAVTAVDNDTGVESLPSPVTIVRNSVNYSVTQGSLFIEWDRVPGAETYRIYRSSIHPVGAQVTEGTQLGYIGETQAPSFSDANIIPDFLRSPPRRRNPFSGSGAVIDINIVDSGGGYLTGDRITINSLTGTGFEAIVSAVARNPATSTLGIAEITILSAGSGYTSADTVVVQRITTVPAQLTLVFAFTAAQNPALNTIFQQRQLYAASTDNPLRLWASRPGELSNFSDSLTANAADAFEFDLDADEVTPIRHFFNTRGGILLMTEKGIWQLSGGGPNRSEALTGLNAFSDLQSFTGVAEIPPLAVENDIIYLEGTGTVVRRLAYNERFRSYQGEDVSILANHFITPELQLRRWTYASTPHKIIYGVRSDGSLLNFTLVSEQEVFGWTRSTTKGLYQEVATVREGNQDVTYFAVLRVLPGGTQRFIERQVPRDFKRSEDAWFVDCGLALPFPTPGVAATFGAKEGVATLTTPDNRFSRAQIGYIVRAFDGKAEVIDYTNRNQLVVTWIDPVTEVNQATLDPTGTFTAQSGEWTIDQPVTEISGLDHLDQEPVAVLSDGNVVEGLTVRNGSITLPAPATRVIVGLPYECQIQTLPLATTQGIIESKRKSIIGLSLNLHESRGLEVGATPATLYEIKERDYENYGEPTALQTGLRYTLLASNFNREGQVLIRQHYPLPATVLGIITDVDLGDDNN